jgi:TRAP transporter TAXI family solute receptor
MNAARPLQWCLIALMLLASVGPASAGAPATPAAPGPTKTPEVVIKGGNYTFAAAPSVSPVYTYWVSIAKAVKTVYPQFNITVTETTGALDITKRIRAKQAALGNSMADLDYTSYLGEEQFQGQPNKKMRILWYYDFLIAQWAVAKSSGIKSIEGLTGKDFNPGGAGGGIVPITKKIFEMFGVKPKYFEATQQSAIEAIENRHIIGLSKTGPVPDSFFQQIMPSVELEMVGLTKEQQAKAIEKYPYWVPYTVPAKTYGNSQEVQTVAVLTGGQTTSDLPEEVGYAFFKAMWEGGKSQWQRAYPSAANNDVIELTLRSPIPLHAGAVRYFIEHGVQVPDRLIPPEYKR